MLGFSPAVRTSRVAADSRTLDCPIRVAFVIDRLSKAGTESQLLALLRSLDRSAVSPSLVILGGGDPESRSLEPDCCPVLRLGVARLASVTALSAAKRLWTHWRAERPDIVQCYFHDSAYFAVPVAKSAGAKRILRVRNNLGYTQTRKHRWLSRAIRPCVDGILTNSAGGRDAIVAMDGLPPDRVHVLENGVDLDRFPPRVPHAGSPIVGCVANLRPVKNIDGLLRIAAMIPRVEFRIAGDGPEREKLEILCRDLGLADRVRFFGSVADIPGFLSQLDVAVLPSHSESLSNSVLEAMAAGLPIVATDVGANTKLLGDGPSGVVVPPGNDGAFAAALTALLGDVERRTAMGLAGRRRVERDYGREAMRMRFERFYRDLVR